MENFLGFLIIEKNFKERSARDVLNRLKRIKRLLGIEKIVISDIYNLNRQLQENQMFQGMSPFVKSQLRRALKLYEEFEEYTIILIVITKFKLFLFIYFAAE